MGVTGELGLLWSRHLECLNPVSGKHLFKLPHPLQILYLYIREAVIFVPYKTFQRNVKSFLAWLSESLKSKFVLVINN